MGFGIILSDAGERETDKGLMSIYWAQASLGSCLLSVVFPEIPLPLLLFLQGTWVPDCLMGLGFSSTSVKAEQQYGTVKSALN
jgi:hypothetical protein